MSSPKRHIFISLFFILKCFSKPLIIIIIVIVIVIVIIIVVVVVIVTIIIIIIIIIIIKALTFLFFHSKKVSNVNLVRFSPSFDLCKQNQKNRES